MNELFMMILMMFREFLNTFVIKKQMKIYKTKVYDFHKQKIQND